MWADNFNINWYAISTIWVIMILNLSIFSSFSLAINNITHISDNNPTYLDDYLYNYSTKSLPKKPHTGVLYNISLPANFSDMKVSVLRLRRSALWSKGVNSSNFDIPPKITTIPYVKRLEIMYENLGNLSSHYYELPGYTFLTKVIGLAVYNASDSSEGTSSKRLNITLLVGESIKVKFSQGEVLLQGRNSSDVKNKLKKCVRFDPLSGLVELRDMLRPNVCLSQGVGHFAIAMPKVNDSISPSPLSPPLPRLSPLFPTSLGHKRRERKKIIALWVWWVVGFAGGLVGLMLLASCLVLGYKTYCSRKIQSMERTSEKSESLNTKWIGNSKFPLAPVSRTQAVLENDFAP
ncbi:uncharacterized protein LOC110725069 [Chenopodium quinoa]|uniref:uncharacterized protein LOC110725069 n=1 Tax=Chenopodium quinoa TaxID=63459 RepID=UPI000B78E73B|nr:uncharacterized protein LOC110725069 [Chenopodium quinoa]